MAAITIVRGNPGRSDAASLAEGEALDFDAPGGVPVPLAAARGLLAQLRARLGDRVVDQAVARRAPALAVVLRRVALDETSARERDAVSGLHVGFLPNVVARSGVVARAWVDLLAELLAGQGVALRTRDAARIDLESLALVRPLVARLWGELRVVTAFDGERATEDALDARLLAHRAALVARLAAIPGAVTVDAAPSAVAEPPVAEARRAVDPLDDDAEWRAFEALHAGSLDRDARAAAVAEGMRASFAALAYEPALRLGLALVALAPEEAARADAHAIVALAAHNLSPLASADDPLLEVTETHFRAALAHERAPAPRAHWLHRLAMIAARGRGDFAAGEALGTRAIDEATRAPADRAALFEAWARNGRAYARFRAGRFAEAADDCDRALARLGDPACVAVPPADVAIARTLVANNRAKLAAATRDPAARARFEAIASEAARAIPEGDHPGFRWVAPPENPLDLSAARRRHAEGARAARERLDADEEAFHAHALAVLDYRVGNAAAAFEGFRTSLGIARALSADVGEIASEEMNCAVAAFRCGRLGEAERAFDALLAGPLGEDDATRAELLGARAMVAAERGDVDAVAADVADATRLAGSSGDAGTLARTLRSVGEAWLASGRRRDAIEAIERGLAVAHAEPTIAAEDRFGLLVARAAAGGAVDAWARDAVAIAPRALHDANAWWDLARLLGVLPPAARRAALDVAAIAEAARQRVDTRPERARDDTFAPAP